MATVKNTSLVKRAVNSGSGVKKHPEILKGNLVLEAALQLLSQQDLSCKNLSTNSTKRRK